MKSILTLTLLFFGTLILGFPQEKTTETSTPAARTPQRFETVHSGTFNGQKISYKAIVGETFLKNSKGEITGSLWSTSYLKEGTENAKRPVLFIFNGGPGSASVWLHMGFFGPKVVKTDSDAQVDDGAAPYTSIPNTQALLDISDLVFIDPIGTGFSEVTGVGKTSDFWG